MKFMLTLSESVDLGGVSGAGPTTTTTTTTAAGGSGSAGVGGGTAFLGNSNGVKVNLTTSQMASLLPIRSTENNIVNRFFSPIESLTNNNNNNNNNINDVRDQIYPPVLVIGTKLDLLCPRSLRSLRRVTSRFDEASALSSYMLLSSSHHHQQYHRGDAVSSDNNYCYPNIMMTPRSCISSVQFFEDTPQSSVSSASVAAASSWNSTYHQHHQQQLTTASMPLSSFQHQSQNQSVYVDLSDSRLSSTVLSNDCNNKVWNFAAEQGFSEILLFLTTNGSIENHQGCTVLLQDWQELPVPAFTLTGEEPCEVVSNFVYLAGIVACVLEWELDVMDEIFNCIKKARVAYVNLSHLWCH
ncbi:unnamed protein product [Trichobilharzia regenti]|nr:unnamed protein product [Trichobilharzia regenti]